MDLSITNKFGETLITCNPMLEEVEVIYENQRVKKTNGSHVWRQVGLVVARERDTNKRNSP